MWHTVNDIPAVIGYAQQLHENSLSLQATLSCMSAIHFSVLIQLKVGPLHELTEAAKYIHDCTCYVNVYCTYMYMCMRDTMSRDHSTECMHT